MSNALQAKIFEDAAKLIEDNGWLNGMTDLLSDCHCLWTATVTASARTNQGTVTNSTEILAEHFGVSTSKAIFALNDSHSEEWAIAQLREISAKLKE